MAGDPTSRAGGDGRGPAEDPFRVGRRVPRNVYRGDEPLFMAATTEQAAELVAILNAGIYVLRSAGTDGGTGGAAEMREACLRLCDQEATDQHHLAVAHLESDAEASATAYGAEEAAKSLAAAIRALPLPSPSPRTSKGGEA